MSTHFTRFVAGLRIGEPTEIAIRTALTLAEPRPPLLVRSKGRSERTHKHDGKRWVIELKPGDHVVRILVPAGPPLQDWGIVTLTSRAPVVAIDGTTPSLIAWSTSRAKVRDPKNPWVKSPARGQIELDDDAWLTSLIARLRKTMVLPRSVDFTGSGSARLA